MNVFLTISLILAAYLLGSVPFALLIGLARGVDIRLAGSGNIGATNLTRTLGRRWGILAFLLDFAKGFAPGLAAVLLTTHYPELLAFSSSGWIPVVVGLAAIFGHVYPLWLRFQGGKGVATAFGVVTALSWEATLAAGVAWLAVYVATRVVSIASLTAAIVLPTTVALLPGEQRLPVLVLTLCAAFLIIYRHRTNIRRLLRGEELRFRGEETGEETGEESEEKNG